MKGLRNPTTFNRFKKWMEKNCVNRDELNFLDITAEFGLDLSYSEAIELAIHKFPSLWSQDYMRSYDNHPKQIIFVKELVKKIENGEVQVTYRKTPKIGTYYIIENRFKQNSNGSRLLIRFYQSEAVVAQDLSDDEARLAGVESAREIKSMFEKWYGNPIPKLYRNWFTVVHGS